ncbi:4Fe-4S ferredoxin [Sporomusaceae bacterium FL31]|nr:4Fe-4S ferredoxin [Sporomusaceae bacterium FL31]GCE32282.1 4Fe-4S ferredoxin [Sporomusaceae bacterium]
MAYEPENNQKYAVKVYEQGCKECGYCIEVCPRQVFGAANYFNDKGYRPVQAKFPEKCIGCRRCFFICPDFSIDVTAKQGGKDSL